MTKLADLTVVKEGNELLELIQFRDSVRLDPDLQPAEQIESLAAIDNQIAAYVKRAAEDVGIVVRQCQAFAAVDRENAKYYTQRAKAWDEREAYIKEVAMSAMRALGTKTIEGAHATLAIRKNPPSCEVSQPALVPETYLRKCVTMSQSLYARLMSYLINSGDRGAQLFAELNECKATAPEPAKSEILAELKQACPQCDGHGIIQSGHPIAHECEACGGTGRRSVAGCRLVDDKHHLEIK